MSDMVMTGLVKEIPVGVSVKSDAAKTPDGFSGKWSDMEKDMAIIAHAQ